MKKETIVYIGEAEKLESRHETYLSADINNTSSMKLGIRKSLGLSMNFLQYKSPVH